MSLLIATFLALLALTNGAVIPIGLEPQTSSLGGRIVGGTASSIEDRPWQVSLQRSGSHFCGGSIISNNIIVTAAHCLDTPTTVSNLRIRAGSNKRTYGGVLVEVAAIKAHEAYNSNSKINDIGVVRLKTKLTFGSTIKAITMASATPAHGSAASISGWGKTSTDGPSSATLLFVDTRIVGRSQCGSSTYGYGSFIKATMICAAATNKDACQGDSGGPLVSGGQLVGVVSWGRDCAVANYPGVYANIAELRDWVLQAQKTV
uniref:trypsin n=2 Tax=Drosophila melanogaster TaxID=7227 RepID=Q4V3S6_DROME|nr:Ser8 [Drosophila melanogaster]AAF58377.1 Ser8 [Drosophila melanogaster]AAY55696.1 IP02554p [Drosophila melanogaster]|eukprot:NP_610874.1 Ser8 [Drosophila melanogaster]